jgi:hypothetical protein
MMKVWASGASYKVQDSATYEYDAEALDLGATFTFGNASLTGYYYSGEGVGTTLFGYAGTTGTQERDSDGGYVQATYVIPTGTKLGVSYGVSNLDNASGVTEAALVESNTRWTVGAYHPLTKHLNLVAEYNDMESEGQSSAYENESSSFSLAPCAVDSTALYSATKFKCLVNG